MRKIGVHIFALMMTICAEDIFAQLFRDELSERIAPESCIFVLEKFDHPANEDCKQEEVKTQTIEHLVNSDEHLFAIIRTY